MRDRCGGDHDVDPSALILFLEIAALIYEVVARRRGDVAAVASEKAKDTAELAKINMAIAGEQRNIEKNYRAIGEWFVAQYAGEIPEDVKPLVDAIAAAKVKIAELEASKPSKEKDVVAETTATVVEDAATEADFADGEESGAAAEAPVEVTASAGGKKCPICGEMTDSRFCPKCGAPMGE